MRYCLNIIYLAANDTTRFDRVYNEIFFTNVLKVMKQKKMKKTDLSEMTGISMSFISHLTTGKSNPSLKTMEAVAVALDVPLSYLLESHDLKKHDLNLLNSNNINMNLPDGYEFVSVVLSKSRAFQVKQWAEETQKKFKNAMNYLL